MWFLEWFKNQAGEGVVGLLGGGKRGLGEGLSLPGVSPEQDTREWVFGSADGGEAACAHLAEARDDFARIAAGELHGVFAQAVEALGERGHGIGLVAVFFGAAAEEVAPEAFECLLQLLVAGEVQRAEAVDGGEHFGGKACGFFTQ